MGMCFCQTGPYKEHFVCFSCRKMFKRPSIADVPVHERPASYEEYRPTCPECGRLMHNLGKEFEPPKQRDLKAWREVERRHREIQRESMTSPQADIRHGGHA